MMMMKTESITIYRILTEALELMGFENATDLNKQYEDKVSGLEGHWPGSPCAQDGVLPWPGLLRIV